MIDCKKAKKLLTAYIDGELGESDRKAFKEHIRTCFSCKEEYENTKKMTQDLASLSSPVPDGLSRRIHTLLVNEQFENQKNKKSFTFPAYRATTAVLAAVVVAIVGKYGVYDVYKNVSNDTQNVVVTPKISPAPETTYTQGSEKANEGDKPKVEKVQPAHNTEAIQIKTEEPSGESFQEDIAEYYIMERSMENVPVVTAQEPIDEFGAEDVAAEESALTRRAVIDNEPLDEIAPVAEVGEDTQETEDLAEDTAEETIPPVTHLVPASVLIHKSGDGSMIMMKKHLLTFLEGNQMDVKEDEIIITISAEEYESVMSKLRENEYVKTVTEGIPYEGKAIISIR